MDLAFDKRRQARGDGLIILRRFNDRLGPEGASRPGQKNQNKQRGKSGTVHMGTHCSDNLSTMSLFLPFFSPPQRDPHYSYRTERRVRWYRQSGLFALLNVFTEYLSDVLGNAGLPTPIFADPFR